MSHTRAEPVRELELGYLLVVSQHLLLPYGKQHIFGAIRIQEMLQDNSIILSFSGLGWRFHLWLTSHVTGTASDWRAGCLVFWKIALFSFSFAMDNLHDIQGI